jgi:heat shock protein HslJ
MKNLLILLTLMFVLAACGAPAPKDVDLVGTAWNLTQINGEPIVPETAPTLNFDSEGLGGNASCNSFGGDYSREGDSLTIGMLFSTMMACEEPIMAQEFAYMATLEQVRSFAVSGNTLSLLDEAGNVLLVFEKQG